jgi:hypothetical protein
MVLDASGNLGIGTNAPRCKLDVPFGAIASGYTAAYTNAGPTDNLDVSLKNTLFVSTAGNSVTIGGLAGGVPGQSLRIVKTSPLNTLTLENVEGGGSQDIYLASGADEVVGVGSVGSWVLEFNGTSWFVSSSVGVAPSICEADFKDSATQDFTGTSGFEAITNFAVNDCTVGYTSTHSNAVVIVAGNYRAYMNVSVDTGAGESFACHLFTNGVEATTSSGNVVGWDMTTSAASDSQNASFSKRIYLDAGVSVDWRIDTATDATLTWDHGTVGLLRE